MNLTFMNTSCIIANHTSNKMVNNYTINGYIQTQMNLGSIFDE